MLVAYRVLIRTPPRKSHETGARSFAVLTAAVLAAAHGAVQSSASLDDHRAQREAVVVEALATSGITAPGQNPAGVRERGD